MAGPPDRLGKVKGLLRSVLLSSKDGIPLRKIAGDYREIVMESLPFRELGFPNMEVFFETIPDVVRLGIDKNGEAACFAVADESTKHIAKLVGNQRSAKKRRGTKFRPAFGHTVRRPASYSTWSNAPKPFRGGRGGRGGRGRSGSGYQFRGTGRGGYPPSSQPPSYRTHQSRDTASYSSYESSSSSSKYPRENSSAFRQDRGEVSRRRPLLPTPEAAKKSPPPSSVHERKPTVTQPSFTSRTSYPGMKECSPLMPQYNYTLMHPYSYFHGYTGTITQPLVEGLHHDTAMPTWKDKPTYVPYTPTPCEVKKREIREDSPGQLSITIQRTPPQRKTSSSASQNDCPSLLDVDVEVNTVKSENREIREESPGEFSVTIQSSPDPPPSSVETIETPSPRSLLVDNRVVKFGSHYQVPPRFRKLMDQQTTPDSSHRPWPNYKPPGFRSSPESATVKPVVVASPSPKHTAPLSPKKSSRSPDSVGSKSPVEKEHKQLLHNYCQKNGLPPPVYDTMKVVDGYVSSTEIEEDVVYGSYGIYNTKREAESSAAKNACSALGITNTSTSSSIAEEGHVRKNLEVLFKKRRNGIWKSFLPTLYQAEFNEDPPSNLLTLVDKFSDIVREEKVTGTDKRILFPQDPQEVSQMSKHRWDTSQAVINKQIESAQLPEQGSSFDAYLANIVDCLKFYVHQVDSTINEVMQILQEEYSGDKYQEPRIIKPGIYVAAKSEEDDYFYRAQVLSVMREKSKLVCDIYYLDFGNCETLPSDRIRPLCERLYHFCAQALQCQLHQVHRLESELWDKATGAFEELQEEGAVTLQVLDIKDGCCIVDMFKDREASTVSFNKELVDRGFATDVHLTTVQDPDIPLVTPEENEWNVTVSSIDNPYEVTIRLIGENYSDKLFELEQAIGKLPVRQFRPREGDVCAAVVEDGGEKGWYRVRVLAVDGDKVECDYLDYGDTDIIDVKNLKLMTQELNSLAYQAIPAYLTGLQNYQDDEKVLTRLHDLAMGKTCVAINVGETEISVTLFDTTGSEDVNINEQILMDVEDLQPKLPAVMETAAGYISFVTAEGVVYFQPQGPGLKKLDQLSASVGEKLKNPEGPMARWFVKTPEVGKLCLAAYTEEGEDSWYRGKITEVMPGRKVNIYYVDYGNTEKVSFSSLRELEPASKEFFQLPPQAIHCHLHGLPPSGGTWTPSAVERLEELTPVDQMVYIEMVQPGEDGEPPEVEIYFLEHGEMIAISQILLEEEVFGEKIKSQSSEYQDEEESNDAWEDVEEEQENLSDSNLEEGHFEKFDMAKDDNVDSAIASDNSENQEPLGSDEGTGAQPAGLDTFNPNVHVPSFAGDFGDVAKTSTDQLEAELEKALHRLDLEGSQENAELTVPHCDHNIDSIDGDPNIGSALSDKVYTYPKHEYATVKSGDAVFVTFSCDPSNFSFIPEDMHSKLDELYLKMNDYYTSQMPPKSVNHNLEKGQIFAGYHEDKQWYRVKIKTVLPTEQICVVFVDFGDFTIMSKENLRVLEEDFCLLPFQSIKGSLAGLTEAGEYWSSEALERFRQLTVEKQLTVWVHESQEADTVSVTLLVDEPVDGEVFIHKILVNEGHAICSTSVTEQECS